VTSIVTLVTTLLWLVVWFLAVGVAAWHLLRGRPVVGVLVGIAAVGGLALLLLPKLLKLVFVPLAGAIGPDLAFGLQGLLYGLGDAVVLGLLVAAVAVGRPRAEA
jgi:hypothetical protein